jgi:hypothetical protein
MRLREVVDEPPNTHRVRRGRARRAASVNGSARGSMRELIQIGRTLPGKLQRAMKTHPGTVLTALGGASFLAGVVLGSRLGRAALALSIPFALEQLIESDLGPRLWRSVEELMGEDHAGTAAN